MGKQIVEAWKPVHDEMLAMHLAAYSNVRIAQVTGYSPEHVSVMLNDPRAEKAIFALRKRLRKKAIGDIEDRMVDLAERSLQNIAETVEHRYDENAVASKGKMHQDDVGFKLLACLGYNGKGAKETEPRRLTLSADQGERLVTALEKSAAVDRLIEEAEEVEVVCEETG